MFKVAICAIIMTRAINIINKFIVYEQIDKGNIFSQKCNIEM